MVTGIVPGQGDRGGGTAVTISGTGFQDGATAKLVGALGDCPLTNVVVVSAVQITGVTANYGIGEGDLDLVVTNPCGASDTLEDCWDYT